MERSSNVSYNPIKSLTGEFSEGLSTSPDNAIVEKKPTTLVGDYNINSLNRKERKSLEIILTPYGLHVLNKTEPTRSKGVLESMIDYISTDVPNASFFWKRTFHTLS